MKMKSRLLALHVFLPKKSHALSHLIDALIHRTNRLGQCRSSQHSHKFRLSPDACLGENLLQLNTDSAFGGPRL